MEKTFLELVADRNVSVQGTHWAALINAWGCVQKDLDQVLSVFDSIATHSTTNPRGAPMPDAVVYEALINSLVTLRRMDLAPEYLERLQASGVHMTAYIANLLIKGYASAGEIERSREIFESLQDPQEGVAAPHNHAPHQNKPHPTSPVPANAPVFREVRILIYSECIQSLIYSRSPQHGKPWSAPSSVTANATAQSLFCSGYKPACSLPPSTNGSAGSCSTSPSRPGRRRTPPRPRAPASHDRGSTPSCKAGTYTSSCLFLMDCFGFTAAPHCPCFRPPTLNVHYPCKPRPPHHTAPLFTTTVALLMSIPALHLLHLPVALLRRRARDPYALFTRDDRDETALYSTCPRVHPSRDAPLCANNPLLSNPPCPRAAA